MLANGEIFMGGEESAGMSIAGHVPEKDGILACLLVTEMVAKTGKSIQELSQNLFDRVGRVYSSREDIRITNGMQNSLSRTLESPPSMMARIPVRDVNRMDGCKLVLEDNSWFLLRPSGTEPLVRCYGEADTAEQLQKIMAAGRSLLQETSHD